MTLDEKTNGNERTFVVAGVNGGLGSTFAKELHNYGALYGIARSEPKETVNYTPLCADLLQPNEIGSAFQRIPPTTNLVYLHMIGKFRFEDEKHPITDKDGNGIDDETYATNVTTFRNAVPYLIEHLHRNDQNRLTIVGIGSTSDLYGIPFWQSFTRAKQELRKDFRRLYGAPELYGRVRSLIINVSTVDGEQLKKERPFISKEYCLSPEEVVRQSLELVLCKKPEFLETSIIRPNPDFTTRDFLEVQNIRDRWYKEMYGQQYK